MHSRRSSADGRLEVTGLSKAFGARKILDGVSFSLEPSSVTCLSGGNGAGKSTLVRCLAGLAHFTGVARLDGISLSDGSDVRRKIGYVPQDPALQDSATVQEVITFFAGLRRTTPDSGWIPDGFLPPPSARIAHLSGGQRQRVTLVVGLLGRPNLLLLDEPVANLDDEGRVMVWEMLGRARDDGTTIVVVSPAPRDLAGLAERVLTLRDGRIESDGAQEAIETSLEKTQVEARDLRLGVSPA